MKKAEAKATAAQSQMQKKRVTSERRQQAMAHVNSERDTADNHVLWKSDPSALRQAPFSTSRLEPNIGKGLIAHGGIQLADWNASTAKFMGIPTRQHCDLFSDPKNSVDVFAWNTGLLRFGLLQSFLMYRVCENEEHP